MGCPDTKRRAKTQPQLSGESLSFLREGSRMYLMEPERSYFLSVQLDLLNSAVRVSLSYGERNWFKSNSRKLPVLHIP
ncbi:hypothetical protein COLO4_04080 [Corchorus olitorius]|uniref:Uncharacterized protein n=1 Tax=Corchorus olitorius TaxID=93759 RepID=A0A1R3KVF2_9ROSI|nr:hypothetical protein COLO4_04080 [Corchorus olitorius]